MVHGPVQGLVIIIYLAQLKPQTLTEGKWPCFIPDKIPTYTLVGSI